MSTPTLKEYDEAIKSLEETIKGLQKNLDDIRWARQILLNNSRPNKVYQAVNGELS